MTETNELFDFLQKMGDDAEEKWTKICEDCKKRGHETPYIESVFTNIPKISNDCICNPAGGGVCGCELEKKFIELDKPIL